MDFSKWDRTAEQRQSDEIEAKGDDMKVEGESKEVGNNGRDIDNGGPKIEDELGESPTQNEENLNTDGNTSHFQDGNYSGFDHNSDYDSDDTDDSGGLAYSYDYNYGYGYSYIYDYGYRNNNHFISRRKENPKQILRRNIAFIKHLTQLADQIAETGDTVIIKAPVIKDVNLLSAQSHTSSTFHFFSRLPSEIRLKIWKLNLPGPHILDVKYRQDNTFVPKRSRLGYILNHRPGKWVFDNPPKPFTNLFICQESRLEAFKSRFFLNYKRIHLFNNITERAWFNFETDTYFLNTEVTDIQDAHFSWEKEPSLFGPPNPPFCRTVMMNLRFLAISSLLWNEWPFKDEDCSDLSCKLCNKGVAYQSQDEFQTAVVRRLAGPIAKISFVVDMDAVVPGELNFLVANENWQKHFKASTIQFKRLLENYSQIAGNVDNVDIGVVEIDGAEFEADGEGGVDEQQSDEQEAAWL